MSEKRLLLDTVKACEMAKGPACGQIAITPENVHFVHTLILEECPSNAKAPGKAATFYCEVAGQYELPATRKLEFINDIID